MCIAEQHAVAWDETQTVVVAGTGQLLCSFIVHWYRSLCRIYVIWINHRVKEQCSSFKQRKVGTGRFFPEVFVNCLKLLTKFSGSKCAAPPTPQPPFWSCSFALEWTRLILIDSASYASDFYGIVNFPLVQLWPAVQMITFTVLPLKFRWVMQSPQVAPV